MNESAPLLTSTSTILWLKVLLTVVTLVLLYVRYKNRSASGAAPGAYSLRTKLLVAFVVLFAFGTFHSFGKPRSGAFVHYGEMFHYYLGAKYFHELGHYELYNAVIVADAEQDNALSNLPFYTDLTTYQNAPREAALRSADRVKSRFSEQRWAAFKHDVAFFKTATGVPASPTMFFLLMDHGYNASPVSTSVLGVITNLVPVTQLPLLATLDVLLVAGMILLVFRTFSLEMGALFSVYFFVNILNDPGYISGGLLRYDWLFCIVAAVCLLEKKRHGAASALLTVSAMIRVFPAVLFYGLAIWMARKWKLTRSLDGASRRTLLAAGVTALALFALPTAYLGSGLAPWKEFAAKTAQHDSGVYVNHIGLRGVLLFEPSQLSLDSFVEKYRSPETDDIVRHWQDVKEAELRDKRPLLLLFTALALVGLTAILWKRGDSEIEGVLWPLVLVYVASYPSHYYYAFLCLFVLLFFRRPNTLEALVPLGLLLILNLAALVTDSFSPSPIAFYTLTNIYMFVCMAAIVAFELYGDFGAKPLPAATVSPAAKKAPVKQERKKRTQKPARRG